MPAAQAWVGLGAEPLERARGRARARDGGADFGPKSWRCRPRAPGRSVGRGTVGRSVGPWVGRWGNRVLRFQHSVGRCRPKIRPNSLPTLVGQHILSPGSGHFCSTSPDLGRFGLRRAGRDLTRPGFNGESGAALRVAPGPGRRGVLVDIPRLRAGSSKCRTTHVRHIPPRNGEPQSEMMNPHPTPPRKPL